MATTPKNRGSKAASNLPRPKRTLALFLAAIIALYGLVALIDFNNKKGEDSAWQPKLGLDLEGGTRITLEAKPNDGNITPDKLDQARDIIDQRVNATGVNESEVTTQGSNQVSSRSPASAGPASSTRSARRPSCGSGSCGPANLSSATTPTDTAAQQAIINKVDWSKLTLDQMIKAETTGLEACPRLTRPASLRFRNRPRASSASRRVWQSTTWPSGRSSRVTRRAARCRSSAPRSSRGRTSRPPSPQLPQQTVQLGRPVGVQGPRH